MKIDVGNQEELLLTYCSVHLIQVLCRDPLTGLCSLRRVSPNSSDSRAVLKYPSGCFQLFLREFPPSPAQKINNNIAFLVPNPPYS